MIIIPKRMTARMQEPFCLFLIGMRIKSTSQNSKMVAGFQRDASDDAGVASTPRAWLHQRPFLVRPSHDRRSIRKSFEALTRYAKQPDLAHLPAWAQFRRNIGSSGDVGIWHETYLIAPGQYENIYHNMPTFGLGQASQLVEASGRLESAEGRVSPVTATARRSGIATG